MTLFTSRRMLPFVVSLAMFMEALDATVINTAIPAMSHSLNVSPIDLKIALISYLVSLAVFIPISGWIADKHGIKRVFIAALAVFTISSFFCGMASNLTELVIARLFQGLGGSLMLPLGRLFIVRCYEKHELLAIMNQVVIVGALGLMLGPTLGGIITTDLSWRWIFFINIPVGILNIVLAKHWLPRIPLEPIHRLDKIGFFLFGAGLAILTFGLSALSESNIAKSVAGGIIAIALLLLILYILHSRRAIHPIVNNQLFQYRTFNVSILGNLFARLGFGGVPFLMPLLLQIGLGYSPKVAGLLLAPTALGILMVKPLSLQILRLVGYKKLLITNTLLMGVTLSLFSLIDGTTALTIIALFAFIFGLLSALQYTGMNSIAYSQVHTVHYSGATSFISTLQQIAQSFGVAISAILLRIFSPLHGDPAVISLQALHHTFIALGLFTSCSILIFLKLKADDGAILIKKP